MASDDTASGDDAEVSVIEVLLAPVLALRDRLGVVILLTDGEDLEKSGIKKAEALAKEGVMVFTVGVGTPAGAIIQTLNEQGQPTLMRDKSGEVVRSRLDETTLRAIAAATHGDYRPLGALGEGLARLRGAIEYRPGR